MPERNQSDTIERWNQLRRDSRTTEAIELLVGLFEDLARKESGKVVVSDELYAGAGGDDKSYAELWNELKIILNDDLGRTVVFWRRCFSEDRQRWRELAAALVNDLAQN